MSMGVSDTVTSRRLLVMQFIMIMKHIGEPKKMAASRLVAKKTEE